MIDLIITAAVSFLTVAKLLLIHKPIDLIFSSTGDLESNVSGELPIPQDSYNNVILNASNTFNWWLWRWKRDNKWKFNFKNQ